MIVSYRDKRTREFASGKRVKAFSGFERAARLKLDRMEAATSRAATWLHYPAITSKRCAVTVKASTASGSTTSGGFASSGMTKHLARPTWRSWTIIRRNA